MKRCSRCKIEKELSEFHKKKGTKDGLQYWCKECRKKTPHDWYLANQQLAIDRSTEWAKNNPDKAAKLQTQYRKRHPKKIMARQAVTHAIREGQLMRETCEVPKCSVIGQAHHDDYSKLLDVRWLCTKHHNELHKGE